MSFSLSSASSRCAIISFARRSSTGIVRLLGIELMFVVSTRARPPLIPPTGDPAGFDVTMTRRAKPAESSRGGSAEHPAFQDAAGDRPGLQRAGGALVEDDDGDAARIGARRVG